MIFTILGVASATLGPMCSGEGFSCALNDGKMNCWDRNSDEFSYDTPNGTYTALTCQGPGGVAIDSNNEIAACFGN